MKAFFKIVSLLFFVWAVSGCEEEGNRRPLEYDANPPGQISNIQAKAGPGIVTLRYTLPHDENLLYVKAVYTLQSGVEREVRASYYTNMMTLDGFFDTEEHEVKIYSYNQSEVASEPVIITVRPEESPIWEIRRTLALNADFMGVKVTAENKTKADVAIQVFYKDSLEKWVNMEGIYTSITNINTTLRGLDTLNYEMGVVIRDRFQNYTDTLYAFVSPYYETTLDKSRYRGANLNGTDTPERQGSEGISKLWDGDTSSSARYMTEQPSGGASAFVTVNIGQLAQISRVKFWTYPEWMPSGVWPYYYRGCPRIIEIWGSENPNPDGSWDDSWFLLSRHEVIKPSGLPYGQMSDEDKRFAEAGFDITANTLVPRAQYLRFKQILNWEGTTWLDMTEIQVYGDNR